MNLDAVFCASECANWYCKKRISMRHIYAAEKRNKELKTNDFRYECFEYIEKKELIKNKVI